MLDLLTSILPDFIGGLFGLGSAGLNMASQAKTNIMNLDYAKAMTEKQWERDDETYQRSVADAQKAGFSPLAVLDGGLSPNGSPLAFQGQAPQLDINGILNSLNSMSTKLHETFENRNKSQQELMKINQEYQNALNLAEHTSALAKDEESWKVTESIRYLQANEESSKRLNEQKENLERLTNLGVITTERMDSINDAIESYKDWQNSFAIASDDYMTRVLQSSESDSETATGSLGLKDIANSSGSITTASKSVLTESQAKAYNDYMKAWFIKNPMPLCPDGSIPPNYIHNYHNGK